MSNEDDLWLDAVLAVPALGFQLKTPPSMAVLAREVLAPTFDQLAARSVAMADLHIAEATAPSGLELRLSSGGFSHKLLQLPGGCNVSVEFSFSPTETKAAGEFPSTTYEYRTYAAIVKDCERRLEIVSAPLLKSQGAELVRVGLAATAELPLDKLPPGFVQFKDWSERPWKQQGGVVGKIQTLSLVRLPESNTLQGAYDQCHHALTYEHASNVSETPYRLMLDYQRTFSKPPARNTVDLTAFVATATAYFQGFGFPETKWA